MLKRVMALVLFITFTMSLCSCGNSNGNELYNNLQNQLGSSAPEAEGTGQPQADKQTLTFAMVGDKVPTNALYNHALAYMEKHPNVEIKFQSLDRSSSFDSTLSVQLMSGTAPDVIIGYANWEFLNCGHLLDLYPFMENDTDFNEEDYYMNIITSTEVDGKLYAMPYSFYFPGLYAMRRDIAPEIAAEFEAAESVTMEELLDWYETTGVSNNLLCYRLYDPTYALSVYYDTVIDLDNTACNFQNQKLMSLLERAKQVPAPGLAYTSEGKSFAGGESSLLESYYYPLTDPDYSYLFYPCLDIVTNPQILFPFENGIFTTPKLLSTSGGKTIFDVHYVMAISDCCENPGLAWDFLKFCITDKTEPYESAGSGTFAFYYTVGVYPSVNRNTYAAHCEYNLRSQYNYCCTEAGMTPVGDKEQVISSALTYMLELPKQLDFALFPFDAVESMIWPDMYLYLTNKQDIDVTMASIQSKVSIYLNE